MKKKNKEITIEDLATMTKKGFDGVYERMDKRFGIVDKRFDDAYERFELIDRRFDLIDKRFDEIDKRFERIEVQIREKFDKLISTLEHFLKRMTDMEDEFAIMKHDINRVKEVIKEKLGVDLT